MVRFEESICQGATNPSEWSSIFDFTTVVIRKPSTTKIDRFRFPILKEAFILFVHFNENLTLANQMLGRYLKKASWPFLSQVGTHW